MSQPYIGEIRIFAGNFAPAGWFFCDGQLLSIAQFETLFQLIGIIYGGDGSSTFALPDLRGRIPIHMGTQASTQYVIGSTAGSEAVALTPAQIPAHNHIPQVSNSSGQNNPANNLWGNWPGGQYSDVQTGFSSMSPSALAAAGSSQPHNNLPPYVAINFIICWSGIFPTQ